MINHYGAFRQCPDWVLSLNQGPRGRVSWCSNGSPVSGNLSMTPSWTFNNKTILSLHNVNCSMGAMISRHESQLIANTLSCSYCMYDTLHGIAVMPGENSPWRWTFQSRQYAFMLRAHGVWVCDPLPRSAWLLAYCLYRCGYETYVVPRNTFRYVSIEPKTSQDRGTYSTFAYVKETGVFFSRRRHEEQSLSTASERLGPTSIRIGVLAYRYRFFPIRSYKQELLAIRRCPQDTRQPPAWENGLKMPSMHGEFDGEASIHNNKPIKTITGEFTVIVR